MNSLNPYSKQSGVALILALLILFVMTILGVASFGNTNLQERGAGNARLQAVAFESAAAGAINSINFFDAHRELGPDQLCGASGHEGWEDPTAWVAQGTVGDATLRQRMYCLADTYPCVAGEEGCGITRPARSQLFVLSRGEVWSQEANTEDRKVIASRDIEVRLTIGNLTDVGDGCGAICFPGCQETDFNFPRSNAFRVDGGGGPAITTGCDDMTSDLLSDIRNNRIGNYIGGVATTSTGLPWNNPDAVEAFRQTVQNAAADATGCMTTCYSHGNLSDNGNSQYGTNASPQITYIDGDVSFGGNISGAGILMVNGNLAWNGTPNFNGLIVVLGGSYTVDGGGHGGDHAGSVVILNAPGGTPAAEFGGISFDNQGGGTADYNFDCAALWAARELLNPTGQGMWSPECNVGPQDPFQAGPTELIIASWRENIGWREEFFGSD